MQISFLFQGKIVATVPKRSSNIPHTAACIIQCSEWKLRKHYFNHRKEGVPFLGTLAKESYSRQRVFTDEIRLPIHNPLCCLRLLKWNHTTFDVKKYIYIVKKQQHGKPWEHLLKPCPDLNSRHLFVCLLMEQRFDRKYGYTYTGCKCIDVKDWCAKW